MTESIRTVIAILFYVTAIVAGALAAGLLLLRKELRLVSTVLLITLLVGSSLLGGITIAIRAYWRLNS